MFVPGAARSGVSSVSPCSFLSKLVYTNAAVHTSCLRTVSFQGELLNARFPVRSRSLLQSQLGASMNSPTTFGTVWRRKGARKGREEGASSHLDPVLQLVPEGVHGRHGQVGKGEVLVLGGHRERREDVGVLEHLLLRLLLLVSEQHRRSNIERKGNKRHPVSLSGIGDRIDPSTCARRCFFFIQTSLGCTLVSPQKTAPGI